MRLQRALVIGLLLALAACGGGGGGGGGASPVGGGGSPTDGGDGGGGAPDGGDGGGDSPGDGDGDGGDGGGGDTPGDGGGGEAPDPTVSRAEIVFPGTRSAATAPTVTVRGIAADSEGVANVTVNGVPAVVTPAATAASRHPRVAKAALAEGAVEWSVEINLAAGENELTVAVEDATGELTENVASSTISYVEVPSTFELDTNSHRLVGRSFTLTPTGYVQHLVQHDYITGEQKIFDSLRGSPTGTCFRPAEDQFLYMNAREQGVRELRMYDFSTREDQALFEIPSEALEAGPGFAPWFYTEQLECDSDHTSAYLLLNYVLEPVDDEPISGFAKSRVIEIPLDGVGIDILTETDTLAAEPWTATDMALAPQTLVAQQDYRGEPEPLSSISLLDGARADLTPGLGVAGLALAPVLDLDRVYVATFEGVDEVDLTVPEKRNISEVAANHPLTFSQSRSIGFDPANNRVLVGDDDLEAVIAIDLTTGERTPLVARNVGEGTPLIVPRAFALTADGLRTYVADDGGNAPARLFEIDLATGNRTEVGHISTAITELVTGFALDEAAGRAYVSGHNVVIAVDLETGSHETLFTIAATDLESISDILLDAQSGRLFIADSAVDGIYALDLVTRDIEVVSQAASRGTGPAFDTAMSMARIGTSNELYVAGQASERITRVDLETGNREELAHNCPTTFGTLTQVLYDEGRDELLISGDRLLSYDLASGQCTQLPRRVHTLQMRITPADQMIGVWFRALLQIDRETGEVVIISK